MKLNVFSFIVILLMVGSISLPISQTHAAGFKSSTMAVKSSRHAAQMVKSRFGGKVLKVSKLKGKAGYRVKLLKDNGHVVQVSVDAATGRMR